MKRRIFIACFTAALLFNLQGVVRAQRLESTEIAGGRGGAPFSDPLPPLGARVVEVLIRAGDQVDAVQIAYELYDRRSVTSPVHGGGGGRFESFRLGEDEYIVAISGRSGDGVDSLQIHTNRRTSRLFGGGGGDREYRIEVPRGNQALGFVGRSGEGLDAIGLIYVPRGWGAMPAPRSNYGQSPATSIQGGGGGSFFEDGNIGEGAAIREIRIHSAERIDSIQAIYARSDRRIVEGQRHGGGGGRESVFRLEPGEYVVGLSGRSGDSIDSLRIHTNRRVSQPFGGQGGSRDFHVEVPAGSQAIGFTGRAGENLDAIGLNYADLLDDPSRRPFGSPRRR